MSFLFVRTLNIFKKMGDSVVVSVDDTQNLQGNGNVQHHSFHLSSSNRRIVRPNTKLAIALALISIGLGIFMIVMMTLDYDPFKKAASSDKIVFPVSDSVLGTYRYAAVAADATNCSRIGASMLSRGGSAVDAAIASCLCTGIINMHNSGIGGGFFMTIWDVKSQKNYVIDARETAPLASDQNMFVNNKSLSFLGPLSIAVPGEIAGYWAAHQRFGNLPWRDLFQPAIEMCEKGIPVPKILAKAITVVMGRDHSKTMQSWQTLK